MWPVSGRVTCGGSISPKMQGGLIGPRRNPRESCVGLKRAAPGIDELLDTQGPLHRGVVRANVADVSLFADRNLP